MFEAFKRPVKKAKGGQAKRQQIRKDELMGEIIYREPQAAFVLMEVGMGCVSCPSAAMESLEEACMVHGMDVNEVVDYLNKKLDAAEER